jgi:acetoacetyl-CoA reductase
MQGRVAIVTGGTRGIGLGLAKRLMADGVHVATVYHRDEPAADAFRSLAKTAVPESMIQRVDVRDPDEVGRFVRDVLDQFGRADYLINNVGVDVFKRVAETTLEEWRLAQETILNAPLFFSQAVLPAMRSRHFGRIVNIGASSKNYFAGAAGLGPFGVHKAALTVLSKTLALEEIAHGITVNVVAPGSTAGAGTNPEDKRIPIDQIPLGRRVLVDEVVGAILYFLSDAAAGVTGQVIGVNGGLST